MKKAFTLSLFILSLTFSYSQAQNPWNGKIVLQGYWWNYWNNNYQYNWADYLNDMAPRLRSIGIDMVWVPPTIKNAGADKMGYSPFDQYDLGDKYQKGTTATRFGNKDEYLKMVATMHANGIKVIQDVVLNHCSDAGSSNGSGGQDTESNYSMKSESGYKNFRYVCYSTPAKDESKSDYYARQGRWYKNYENFHPNMWDNTTSTNWTESLWGPDFCYEYSKAYGTSSNVSGYNPSQYESYNVTEARKWIIWMKKQTGIDGIRWDAVKHFPYYIVQDLSWNLKYNAGWANGGTEMFNVGEYVGSITDMDNWISAVKTSNGGTEDLAGTFDFSLRQELKNLSAAKGSYNIGNIVNYQQSNRTRTVPFVNNHDTYRPNTDANGNITSWDTANELGGGHIDSDDSWLSVAYAIALSVDGSPQIFFEDLFKLNGTSKRYSHLPTSTTDLPVRDDIANLIWCHQNLSFKAGAYKVRYQGSDLLVIERSGKAVIGICDNQTTWQNASIQTDFAAGTKLHDYSGSNSADITVDSKGKITVYAPPVNGTATRKGYCVWAPAGYASSYNNSLASTTQEWEMADDLGDSHASSLKEGGALPASSTALRTVGKIYSDANKQITLTLTPTNTNKYIKLTLYNSSGSSVATTTGKGTLTLSYTPTSIGFYTIKIKNYSSSNPAQNVNVIATYTAPRNNFTSSSAASVIASIENTENPLPISLNVYPNPTSNNIHFDFALTSASRIKISIYDLEGKFISTIADQNYNEGNCNITYSINNLKPGIYLYNFETEEGTITGKILKE